MTDEEFNAIKKAAREEANNDPTFKIVDNERAAAYLAQRKCPLNVDKKLAELERLLKQFRD